MTNEEAIRHIKTSCYLVGYPSHDKEYETRKCINGALDMAIKALERDNEEIFKQFKKKAFLESEDILGNEMVDSYMITDYLAELLGVEND